MSDNDVDLLHSWDPETYDRTRRQLVPSLDALYESAGQVVSVVPTGPAPRVLDLGTGTGLLSAAILDAVPGACLTLSDASPDMLAQARARFAGNEAVEFVEADFFAALSHGPFDAVVSSLAIHHLTNDDKKRLFREVRSSLADRGVFVNVEQVRAPDAETELLYDRHHESHVFRSRTDRDDWEAGRRRMKNDIPVDIFSQMSWLDDAGFSYVDCVFKDWRFATLVGWAR